ALDVGPTKDQPSDVNNLWPQPPLQIAAVPTMPAQKAPEQHNAPLCYVHEMHPVPSPAPLPEERASISPNPSPTALCPPVPKNSLLIIHLTISRARNILAYLALHIA